MTAQGDENQMKQMTHQHQRRRRDGESGFSLVELLVAMLVMTVVSGAAMSLLLGSFNVRVREDQRSEGISDARRALNTISRELSSAGYALPPGMTYSASGGTQSVPPNGLIPEDCDQTQLTFVANLNGLDGTSDNDVVDLDEGVKYQFVQEGGGLNYLVRKDLNLADSSVLANRLDGVQFDYLDAAGNDLSANKAAAVSVRVTLFVTLNPVGRPGTAGYQAASRVNLTSLVNLRNVNLGTF